LAKVKAESRKMSSARLVNVVLGSQWGDEGKGKVVDMIASKADIVCRCQVRDRCAIATTIASFLLLIVVCRSI
jgi:hypothetical protein